MSRAAKLHVACIVAVGLTVSAAARGADDNLIANPGLEAEKPFGWFGSVAAVERVKTQPRSGVWCVRVRDGSTSRGQANSPSFPVKMGPYYVEAWIRVAPDRLSFASLDVQFLNSEGKYLSTSPVAQTGSRKWFRVSGTVIVPEGAASASFRLVPTGLDPRAPLGEVGPLKGECFGDDFYVAPLAEAIKAGRAKDPADEDAQAAEDRLVLHYTFDTDPGSVAKDLSPHGNNGKIVKGKYLDEFEGRRGVLRFDGQDSFIDCGGADSLDIEGDMSFEMWVRLNQELKDRKKHDWAFVFGEIPRRSFFFCFAHFHTLMFWYHTGAEAMPVPVDRNILGEKWSHIAVVVEYPRCRVYHNGKLVRDAYMPVRGIAKLGKTRLHVGGNPPNDFAPMDLDELRLYRRALTAGEVAAHARGEEVPPGRADELAVEPHWYEKTVALRLSCKGAAYSGHTAEMALLRGGTPVFAPKQVALEESTIGSGRHVATATFPLAGIQDQPLEAAVNLLDTKGRPIKTIKQAVLLTKPDWVDTPEGYSDEVPPPWTPVTAKEQPDGTIELGVWGRWHVFDKTPFPRRIVTRDTEILAAPITLSGRVDGEPISWKNARVSLKEAAKTSASLAQTAEDDSVTLRIDTSIEYDGYMIFDVAVKARRDLSLENLALNIPLRSECATLCFGKKVLPPDPEKVLIKQWYGGEVRGDLSFRFTSTVFLGNEELGLHWAAESDEDWRYADKYKALEILPRGDTTTFRAHFIDVPTRLAADDSLHYKFALQATPVKPMLRDSWDLRIARSDPYGNDLTLPDRTIDGKSMLRHYADAGLRHLFINVNDIFAWPMPTHPGITEGFRRLSRATHAHGLKLYQYVIHERVAVTVPEFDVHGLHMANTPLKQYYPGGYPLSWKGQSGPVATRWGANSQGCVMFCGKSKALQDAYINSLARRLDAFGEDGVYLDGTGDAVPCTNATHGCGYRAADGSIRETFPVFANREFMKRLYITIKTRKPDAVIDLHCSAMYNPALLAYADMMWTGEQWYHQRDMPDLESRRVAGQLVLDKFRTEFMGYNIGTAAETLSYRLGSRMRVSAISLLHDIPVRVRTQEKVHFGVMSKLWRVREQFGAKEAEKLFYWNNQDYASVVPELCHTTLFKHRTNGVLAFVSNLSPDKQVVSVTLNMDKLGLRGKKLDVFKALTAEPVAMTPDGKLSIPLGSEEWVYVWLRPELAEEAAAMLDIELRAIRSGYDRKSCWVHARPGVIPGDPPVVVVTMSKMSLARGKDDVYYSLHEMRTDDGGKTWTGPIEHAKTLGRRPVGGGAEEGICDFWPMWHAKTGVLLGTGHSVFYVNDNHPVRQPARSTTYSVYDPVGRTWIPWKRLQMPGDGKFRNEGAGSTQRVDLPNGEILLPSYFALPGTAKTTFQFQGGSTVLRCGFDGEKLTYIEHGDEFTVPTGRGLCEPSLTLFAGRYYLTLRNDNYGAVTSGTDGLHFAEPRRWTWDDGADLGNYNTQQHWVTMPNALYLVYTRRGAGNDHVFRHRAPLFIARVDPERLCLIRDTEQVLVPQRGARLGNFGVAKISETESWVTVAEWMQTTDPNPWDSAVCEKYGSDNSVFVAKIRAGGSN